MRHLRTSLLKKIAQDVNNAGMNENYEGQKILLEEIMKELGREFPPPPGAEFKVSDSELERISEIQAASDEEIKELERIMGILKGSGVSSPEEGRALTAPLSDLEGAAKLNPVTSSLNVCSSKESELILESIFKARFKKLANHAAVDAICADLRRSGAFKLYDGGLISKRASFDNSFIEKNIKILNYKVKEYQKIEKEAQFFDFGKIKNLSGDALKGAVSVLSNVGGTMLSGAWSLLKTLGKGVLRILPFVAIIWDVWDLFNHGYTSLNIWFSEFAKYNQYGDATSLADISYLEKLYSENKGDLNKVSDIVKIINLSQAFDEGWVMSITSLILVIEDIITFVIDLTGLGIIVDVLLSLGIYAGGRIISSNRSLAFEDLKDVVAADTGAKYQELITMENVRNQAQGAPDFFNLFS